jgi:hypothetical protein
MTRKPEAFAGAEMKIDRSGSRTSGSMMPSIMPILTGRATSKPRTCLMAGIFIQFSIRAPEACVPSNHFLFCT